MKLPLLALVGALALGSSFGHVARAEEAKPKSPDPKAVSAADTEKYLAFFDKVVDTVTADKDDCNKMGDDLGGLFAANNALLEQANANKKAGQKFTKVAQDHLLGGIKKMAPAINKCMANEKVAGAFKTFAGKDTQKGKH